MRTDLRFGIVSAATGAEEQLKRLCDELGKHVGQVVTGRVMHTFPELVSKTKAGELDLAWTPPISAVELEQLGIAKIALAVWRGAGSTYSSAIFTLASSSITNVAMLRGKRMAWVDPSSAAGYVFPRLKLLSMGLDPDRVFVGQTFWRTHEDCARAVFTGRADAGATCVAFYPGTTRIQSAGWSKGGAYPDSDVRILETAGPIPTDAIVIATSLPDGKRTRLADALMKISVAAGTRDVVRTLFSGEGFVFVGSSQYDGVRALLRR